MKKLLLTLAAAIMSLAVNAEEVNFNLNDVNDSDLTGGEWIPETQKEDGSINAAKHYEPVATLTIEGFTFSTKLLNEKGTKPAFYYATSTTAPDKAQKTLRVYKDTELTFTAPEGMVLGTVEFTGSNIKATTATTVSTGKLTSISGTKIVWNGQANSFTMKLDGTVRIASVMASTEGGEVGPEPAEPIHWLNEKKADAFDDWTVDNVDLDPELEYVWSWKSYNNAYYLNGSGYKNGALAAEALAISPVLDLAGVDEPKCWFEHAAKFQTTLRNLCGMLVREEGATEWTALTIPEWPEAGSWNFVQSGEISLAAFAGKKVQVAFKYVSTSDGADTWEIRNLMFNVIGESGNTPEPTVETTQFTLATTVAAGSYILAIDGKVGSNIVETASYGRLNITDADVTVSGNTITAPTAYGIKIASTDNGYTLTDCFNRYLGMDANYLTIFQLYTELNDGCYWTISLADNGTATIVNKLTECTVSQSKGSNGDFYSNIAPAKLTEVAEADYNLPKLYVAGSGSVSDVAVDVNAPAVYFNLQGVQVKGDLTPGLYIRRQGNTASKVLVK